LTSTQLYNCVTGANVTGGFMGYSPSLLTDPWGQPYSYEINMQGCDGTNCNNYIQCTWLFSSGPDTWYSMGSGYCFNDSASNSGYFRNSGDDYDNIGIMIK
jgi:hypothetical protein